VGSGESNGGLYWKTMVLAELPTVEFSKVVQTADIGSKDEQRAQLFICALSGIHINKLPI